MKHMLGWGAVWVLTMATPVMAQSSAPPLTEQQLAAVHQAEERGASMIAYDRAAWKATDAFLKDAAGKLEAMEARGLKGYVVEPGEGPVLLISFFGRRDGKAFAVARYAFDSGGLTGGLVEGEPPLSPMALRLADARDKAMIAMRQPDHGLCSQSPPNTLVLPQPDGTILAYVLTSTTDAATYPAGGHYRFDFDATGRMVGERRFMKTCYPIGLRQKDGTRPSMMFLTHLLDPQPTEIHAFVSRNLPFPMMIATVDNRRLWKIDRGTISSMGVLPERDKGK